MGTSRCPKCGSYNTRTAYENYAVKGLKYAAAIGGPLLGTLITGNNPSVASKYRAQMKVNKLNSEHIKKNKCNDCGHQW